MKEEKPGCRKKEYQKFDYALKLKVINEIQNEVSVAIDEQHSATVEISEAVGKTTLAGETVSTAILQVADTAEKGLVAANDLQCSAEDITSTSATLKEMVDGFKVKHA